ncbi:MAG TPA: M23 family metallopeptidase [Stellaceae bacterium]|nr:M23 family metallopeptidase [Stellaceae bacterium]
MKNAAFAPHRVGTAVAVLAAGLLAACSSGPPAPVIIGQATAPPFAAPYPPPIAAVPMTVQQRPPPMPRRLAERLPRPPAASGPRQGVRIVVQRGQSVGGLAEKYHVPVRDIIAANRLPPPYGIEIGQHLLIPGATRRPPPRLAAAPPRWVRQASERPPPEIIPLDGPAPRPAPEQASRTAAAAPHEATPEYAAAPPDRGGLLWPVRGQIIEGYGVTPTGGRNAGINIAAPQGAPVRAVDGGVVAYAGNQLRGYGNLVLIKHPDGLISAYAHCETLLVHRGEQVVRGQVIARVGETGGVDRPQLHFELRQGERALDPRRFLGPLPG